MMCCDSWGESSDEYFDSLECLSLEEEFDYGVWSNEPKSVQERRENFLRGMDLSEFASSCDTNENMRLCETSGAVAMSSCDSGSDSLVECCLSSSNRESGNRANSLTDESGNDDESGSTTSSEFRYPEKVDEVQNACKRKLSRWWSFLTERRRSFKEDSVSAEMWSEGSPKSPVLSQLKVWNNHKRWKEFTGLYLGQEIQAHSGVIRAMKFSPDGRFLASGGSDGIVRVWRVDSSNANFENVPANGGGKVKRGKLGSGRKSLTEDSVLIPDKVFWIDETPVHEFHGHIGDILDLAWSNSNHLLSSSTDKMVRLWNLSLEGCVDIFHHSDYVTCIQFNPADENYFISGSIDGKVRVWGVSERRVVDWADVRDIITAICYQSDGKGFVVGSVVGTCHFFEASGAHLHLYRTIDVQGRKRTLNRITSITLSCENSQRAMIASEDGKIRVLDGPGIVKKYRGLPKTGCQLSASFSSSEKHIVSVGDDSRVYLWNYDSSTTTTSKSKTVKSVRSCEYFISDAVSVALPWSCTGTDSSLLGINSRKNILNSSRRLEYPSGTIGSDRFSIGNWFSIEGPCLGTPTWPEEKLSFSELSEQEPCQLLQPDDKQDCSREAVENDRVRISDTWGFVIVTASFDGKIRAFHNYGLPVRL